MLRDVLLEQSFCPPCALRAMSCLCQRQSPSVLNLHVLLYGGSAPGSRLRRPGVHRGRVSGRDRVTPRRPLCHCRV